MERWREQVVAMVCPLLREKCVEGAGSGGWDWECLSSSSSNSSSNSSRCMLEVQALDTHFFK